MIGVTRRLQCYKVYILLLVFLILTSCKEVWVKQQIETLNSEKNSSIDNMDIRQQFVLAPQEIIFEDYTDGRFFLKDGEETGYFIVKSFSTNRYIISAVHTQFESDDYEIVVNKIDEGIYQVRFSGGDIWVTYYMVND